MGSVIKVENNSEYGKKVTVDGVEQNNVISVSTEVTADTIETVTIVYAVDKFTLVGHTSLED